MRILLTWLKWIILSLGEPVSQTYQVLSTNSVRRTLESRVGFVDSGEVLSRVGKNVPLIKKSKEVLVGGDRMCHL